MVLYLRCYILQAYWGYTKETKKDGFIYYKTGRDLVSIRRSLSNRLIYSMGKDPLTATHRDWSHTTAYAVRERLIEG